MRKSPALQRGAAILLAMLIVTLVAALSAAALWQQWRGIEVEAAERRRLQSSWILQGALDWTRQILSEDARSGATDHLAEPWAVPLKEARLSTFLASGQGQSDTVEDTQDAFLSGGITDLQSRLNVLTLVQDGKPSTPGVRAFARLFDALRLPEAELLAMVQGLQRATAPNNTDDVYTPLLPRTFGQLAWLGLSSRTLEVLTPYVTVLPERTPVNINTAPALVLHAAISTLSLADANRLATMRAQSHFRTLGDAATAIGAIESPLNEGQHSVNSRYFEVRAKMRIDNLTVQDTAILQRDGLRVKILGRQRGPAAQGASVQSYAP
jgi:general secretion pathway protein K